MESEEFLLKYSWPVLRVYQWLGLFPCRKYHTEDGRVVIKRVHIFTWITLMIVSSSVVAIGMALVPIVWITHENQNVTFVDFMNVTVNGFNVTTTDYVALVGQMIAFILLFWVGQVKNFSVGNKVQSLIDLFSSIESFISNSTERKASMKRTYYWVIM